MNKKQLQKEIDLFREPIWSQIRLLSVKLRSLGYLIGNQSDEDLPLDFNEIQWGFGLLLEEMASSLRESSKRMEIEELRLRKKV